LAPDKIIDSNAILLVKRSSILSTGIKGNKRLSAFLKLLKASIGPLMLPSKCLGSPIIILLTERDNKSKTKLLENLKTKINNWEVIDSEIEKVKNSKISTKNIRF
jgi:hypothetical protein